MKGEIASSFGGERREHVVVWTMLGVIMRIVFCSMLARVCE
jgi:hypothetical protein